MRGSTSGLTTRQFKRESVELAVEFAVSIDHRGQVCFASGSRATDAHTVRGMARDLSSGGLGLVLECFVPRMCEGTVRVFDPMPSQSTDQGHDVQQVVFEHEVTVRRVSMERQPDAAGRMQSPDNREQIRYAVGVAFIDPGPEIEERINRLKKRLADARDQHDARKLNATEGQPHA